ncbi:putative uridine nucleosidase 2 [Trachymyrmex cornetzi]|uniref:Putative uridine nucleosidase 2 n=1 Tax=Trachymyrmex cornetzi TaxID=471704 RepID=A0A151IWI4_9HYME|nr:putative uridine nucleosidase 2 [Trachymyrmex cornetzi]
MLALMYEAKTHDIEILAIAVSYGNTYLKTATTNMLKILTVADKKVISFRIDACFASTPYGLSKTFKNSRSISYFFTRSDNTIPRYFHSTNRSIIHKVLRYEITIITLGPLTTIATAIALEPNFLRLTKQHIIMGANFKTNEIEFNFQQDPESDWVALNNVDKPSIIVPIDTVNSHVFSQEICMSFEHPKDIPRIRRDIAQATGSVPETITNGMLDYAAKIVRNNCHLIIHIKTYNETLLGCILFITSRIYSYSCNGCFANVLSGNQTGGAVATNGVSRPKCSLPLPNTALM